MKIRGFEVRGNADEAKRALEQAERKAREIYGCSAWLVEGCDGRFRGPVRDNFMEVLVAAGALAMANNTAIRVLGVHPDSEEDIPILTLQPPSALVERWCIERAGLDKMNAASIGDSVVHGATRLVISHMASDVVPMAPGSETEH